MKFRSNGARALGAALCLLCSAALAAAPQSEDRPWAEGVSESEQSAAMQLFREGNALLKDSVFVQATQKYREALAHWDHPAIHYNLVLALLNLDQPVEVHEHLEAAMRYGPSPLDADKFEQARKYKVLIEKQLARVEVRCEVPGASVVMDGRPLFTAPGHYEGLVRAGPHTVVATREGYLTNELSRSLPPGETTVLSLKLFTSESLTRYRRHWGAWMPWTVVAGGAALAVSGGVLHLNAKKALDAYDSGVSDCGGCVPGQKLQSQLERGRQLQSFALGGYVLGGAALAAGATLVYFNRLEPYRVNPEALEVDEVSVVPLLAPGGGGALTTVRF